MTVTPDLDRRFRDAAAALDLIDVGFDIVDSPIGELLVAASDRGVATIWFDPDPREDLERLARIAGPRVLRSPRSVDDARRELDEYFEGRRRAFDLTLDLRSLPPFTVSVLGELARVPYGETTTYGALARACRTPACSTRRRHGDEPQPDPDRPPVPPRGRLRRATSPAMRAGSTASARCSSSRAPASRSLEHAVSDAPDIHDEAILGIDAELLADARGMGLKRAGPT